MIVGQEGVVGAVGGGWVGQRCGFQSAHHGLRKSREDSRGVCGGAPSQAGEELQQMLSVCSLDWVPQHLGSSRDLGQGPRSPARGPRS